MKMWGIFEAFVFCFIHGPSEIAKKVSRGKNNGIVE
jgi:hypothetical protein